MLESCTTTLNTNLTINLIKLYLFRQSQCSLSSAFQSPVNPHTRITKYQLALYFQSFDLMKGKRSKQQVQDASLLISDFTDQSIEKRINAAKNIKFIADVLGSDRVKSQLLPFLKEQVIYDEPQVVLQMINNIDNLGEVIGGGVSFTFLFGILEDALEYEEERVRKLAVQKYNAVINLCDLQKCQNQIVLSLKRLFTNEYDEVKEAFCCVVARKLGLFAVPNQLELIANYLSLAEDPNSLVRRKYAAKYSRDLIQWLNCGQASILKIIEVLSKDKEQSNKIHLIDAIIELARVKSPATLQSYFNLISYQFSWRIRYQLISKIDKLAQAMGRQNFKTFLTYYIKYLNDIEPEIRSIANSKLEEIVSFIEVEDIMSRVVPALKNIPQDTHVYVRNSLASSLLHLCPVIGKKNTIEAILPKFLVFLKDEQQQQVKQTIFKKVSLICETLGIETLSQSVLPILQEMMTNQHWRVRADSINILFYLIKNSPPTFINDKIMKFIAQYLKDRANAVRKQGVKLIVNIIDQHGQAWVQKNIIPKLLPMFKSATFMHRQTILLALQTLIPKLTQDCLGKQIFSNIYYLAQDQVENVRMSVCVALGTLYGFLPKQKDAIKKILRNLKEDKDVDVKELAIKTMAKLD